MTTAETIPEEPYTLYYQDDLAHTLADLLTKADRDEYRNEMEKVRNYPHTTIPLLEQTAHRNLRTHTYNRASDDSGIVTYLWLRETEILLLGIQILDARKPRLVR